MEGVPQSSRVPADKRQKTDSFPDRQKEALNLRAMARFGKAISSGKLAVGGVFPVMIKSFQSFTPSNVTMLDARRMLSGGYVQRNVRLTLALVVAEEGGKSRSASATATARPRPRPRTASATAGRSSTRMAASGRTGPASFRSGAWLASFRWFRMRFRASIWSE